MSDVYDFESKIAERIEQLAAKRLMAQDNTQRVIQPKHEEEPVAGFTGILGAIRLKNEEKLRAEARDLRETEHYNRGFTLTSEVLDEDAVELCDSFLQAVGKFALQGFTFPSAVLISGPSVVKHHIQRPRFFTNDIYEPVYGEAPETKGFAVGYSATQDGGGSLVRDVFLCDDGNLRMRSYTRPTMPGAISKQYGLPSLEGEATTNLPFNRYSGSVQAPIVNIVYFKKFMGYRTEYEEEKCAGGRETRSVPYKASWYVTDSQPTTLKETLESHIETMGMNP